MALVDEIERAAQAVAVGSMSRRTAIMCILSIGGLTNYGACDLLERERRQSGSVRNAYRCVFAFATMMLARLTPEDDGIGSQWTTLEYHSHRIYPAHTHVHLYIDTSPMTAWTRHGAAYQPRCTLKHAHRDGRDHCRRSRTLHTPAPNCTAVRPRRQIRIRRRHIRS
jgi:hypothetical protein